MGKNLKASGLLKIFSVLFITFFYLLVVKSTVYAQGLSGDANGDGRVDGVDYVIWLNHYNTSSSGPSSGDFNNSGNVDGVDYVIWLNNYGAVVATSTPGATSTPTESAGGPSVSVSASYYSDLSGYLRGGDSIVSGVIRQGQNNPPSRESFDSALESLGFVKQSGVWVDSLHLAEKGISRNFVFSSYRDLQTYIDDLPDEVEIVSYNMEGQFCDNDRADQMTPCDELDNRVSSVETFANLAKSVGKRAMYIPIRSYWHSSDTSGINRVLTAIDMVDYQAQKVLGNDDSPDWTFDVDRCISTVSDISERLKSINSDFEMGMQLWARRPDNTPEGMTQCINGVKDDIDFVLLVGIDDASLGEVEEVFQGLSWR